jgi:hypothetical protein
MDSMARQGYDRGVSWGLRRVGAASGIAYLVVSSVGNGMATSGQPGVLASGEEILAWYKANTGPAITIGIGLEFLGFAAFMCFLAYLYGVLRDAEGQGGWLATAALGGGLVSVAVKLASYGSIWATMARRDVLSAEAARTLNDLNSGAFFTSWFTHGVFLLAASAVVLQTGVLPRVLGWSGLVLGVGCIAAVMAPTAGPAVVPYLLSGLWLVAVSVVLLRRAIREPLPASQPAALVSP